MSAGKNGPTKRKSFLLAKWGQEHLPLLSWAVPLAMVLLVVGYELGPANWVYENLGYRYHVLAEEIGRAHV